MECHDRVQNAHMSMSEQAVAYPAAGAAMHESLMRRAAGVHGHDDTPGALMPLKPNAHNACITGQPASALQVLSGDSVLHDKTAAHGLGVAECWRKLACHRANIREGGTNLL